MTARPAMNFSNQDDVATVKESTNRSKKQSRVQKQTHRNVAYISTAACVITIVHTRSKPRIMSFSDKVFLFLGSNRKTSQRCQLDL